MTQREFFEGIIANIEGTEGMSDFVEHAKSEIAKLDKRNLARSSKPSKVALANEPIKKAILELLENAPMVASQVGVELEISTQKASALLVQLSKEGKVEVSEVKVKGKGKVKSYSLTATDGE